MTTTTPPPAPVWADTAEPTDVADLRAGDYITDVPAQGRYRGLIVNSGIREITDPAEGRWTRNAKPGARRTPLLSRRITVHAAGRAVIELPVGWTVNARRYLGEPPAPGTVS